MNIKQTKPKITWLPVRRKNKKTGKLSDTVELMKVITYDRHRKKDNKHN